MLKPGGNEYGTLLQYQIMCLSPGWHSGIECLLMLDCSSGLIKGIRFVFTVGIVWRARITSILSVI